MFAALVSILLLPIVDLGKLRGYQFKPFEKIAFYIFAANVLVLKELGAKHVENPFVELGQASTGLYFIYFIAIVLIFSLLGNTLSYLDLYRNSKNNNNNNT